MSVQTAFEEMLGSTIAPALAEARFREQQGCFVRRESLNLLVIEPQQSIKSTSVEILFTFNLKVISARLAPLVDGCQHVSPGCPVAHWRKRLGGLLLRPRDHWWSFDGNVPTDALDVLVNSGLPAIGAVAADESLRDLWLTGRAPGLSDLQRVIYLSTLLALLGPTQQLSDCVSTLQAVAPADPTRGRVDRHLGMLATLQSGGTNAV